MKFVCLSLLLAFLVSCKPAPEQPDKSPKILPDAISAILDHHGGLAQWQKMKSMTYEIVKEGGNEKHQIDLVTRNERIEASNFLTGYDGEKVWLQADTSYKGNAIFYHNLIFYFYAMPFVVADDGIIYSKMEPLEFEGVNYPGIRISYESDIGFSPEDEYFIYYNASTNEMAWLGYTVTYFTKEKSKDVHWIRYDDWGDHNGLRLPNSLSWYKYENGLPTEFRNEVEFTNISVTENELSEEVFAKPVRADYVAPTRLND